MHNWPRRALLAWLGAGALPTHAQQAAPRTLVFPRDHGAHPEFGIEWWYVTGWLQRASANGAAPAQRDSAGVAAPAERDSAGVAAPAYGFQITFFRSRTGLAQDNASRFAARQLLFAHAAVSRVAQRSLLHAERLVRWSGDTSAPRDAAALDDTRVHIGDWRLSRSASGYTASMSDEAQGFGFDLTLAPTQPLLLQGNAGFSRKGPQPNNASHYYSQIQLEVKGLVSTRSRDWGPVRGRAWLDHEWSGSLMPDGAVGWDWIGINFDDGSALTAFRLRDARGNAVWSGGSVRPRDGAQRSFVDGEVTFEPLRQWSSAATRTNYVVHWRVRCPAGAFEVRALFDAQELDARNSTGTVYWEGLAALHRADDGVRVGWGYLEMTGYAAPLRL